MHTNHPIRVLQIVGRMDRGGIENFVMNIYRNIDREKVQFDFLCHYGKEAAFNDEIRSMGGKIYEMPAIRSENKVFYWKAFEYISALNAFFQEHREFKIIHGQMTNTASIYMPIAKKYDVTTRIAHSHNSHGKIGMLGVVTNILKKNMFKHATDYFACSEAAAKYAFPEHIVNAGKVKIIPNAIDIQRFRFDEKKRQEMRSKLGVDDKLVIGCVGRFRTEKNQGFLLGVLKDALKIAPSSVLLFVGDGPLEDAVKQKAEEMGFANKCIFMGMQPNVPEIMQAIDVLAMPSMFEGLPLTGIEAQANGLSIVASTGIPREMNVLGLVDFLDLSMSTEKWAEVLVKKALEPKKDTYDDIKKAGYDIHTTAEWLQDFYLKHG